jgi:hypothetical protein
MESINLWGKLFEQVPVIVVMGVVIWWLARKYESKDKQLETLAKDFVQLSVKWHDWLEKGLTANKDDAEKIMDKLDEIREIVERKK